MYNKFNNTNEDLYMADKFETKVYNSWESTAVEQAQDGQSQLFDPKEYDKTDE